MSEPLAASPRGDETEVPQRASTARQSETSVAGREFNEFSRRGRIRDSAAEKRKALSKRDQTRKGGKSSVMCD